MDYRENYKLWLEEKSLDPKLRAELEAIADDPREQEERFYTELEFGTAGLRGIIGAGTNRMNIYVVRRATQGLADYLKTFPGGPERGVAIAYDSRHMSDVFAKETALVLAQNGIKAYLYSTLHSVPQLSFTVLHLNCMAGQPQPAGVQRLQGILAARRTGRPGAGLGDIGIYPQGGLL